ncbi:hypothetical protein [Streptomyces shenzhenensis]|uniref:hypothetical protein n=1 Tax=Streptomyces shenzhenensis TaxID=943815 RepID=UPI00217E4F0F|nr:hypothetical protein [Streptomyces shenzhenensis]
MLLTRSTAVTAGIAAAAALAATGITYASATSTSAQASPVALQAAPVQEPFGGNVGKGNEEKGENEEKEGRGKEFERGFEKRFEEGRIHINERTYSSQPDGCITVVSGLGAKTLNIRNESRRTVEVFRGVVCDNGAPIATVGPHSSSTGVKPGKTEGIFVEDGVVASFRVIKERHEFTY